MSLRTDTLADENILLGILLIVTTLSLVALGFGLAVGGMPIIIAVALTLDSLFLLFLVGYNLWNLL